MKKIKTNKTLCFLSLTIVLCINANIAKADGVSTSDFAVFNDAVGNSSITQITLTGDITATGNDIRLQESSNLTILGNVGSNYYSLYGANTYKGFQISNGKTLILNNIATIGNFKSNEYGGTISVQSGGSVEITGNGTTFTNNTSSNGSDGCGAIYNDGTFTIGDNANFTGNASGYNGGAIYNEGTFTIGNNATFTGNASGYNGGAIYNGYSTFIINDNASFTNNKATNGYGGAIYNEGTFTINGGATFTDNSGSSGGAISNGGTFTINGGATFKNNSSSYGGVISNGGTFTINGGATFTDNTIGSGGSGGAIYNNSGTFTINGGATFTDNTIGSGGSGGAIYNNSGTFTINGGATFTNNTSSYYGGAIYNDYNGTFTIGDNANFTNNSSSDGNGGGAIGNNNGTFTIGDNANFTNNSSSDGNGGGAIGNNNGTFTIGNNATFIDNTIGSDGKNNGGGGAIYNYDYSGGTFTIGDNAKFEGNASYYDGGAISSNSDTFTINGGANFTNNSSSDGNGGAIYNSWSVIIKGGATFTGNKATNGNGGAIYNGEGILTLINNGGAITFSENTDSTGPNDIHFDYGGTLNITDDSEASNVALGTITFKSGLSSSTVEEWMAGFAKINSKDIYEFYAKINKTSKGILVLDTGSINRNFTGIFTQTAGKTIVKSDFFGGNSIISADSILSIDGDGNTVTFTGNLLGDGAVNKIDAGTLALDTGSINRNFTGIFTQTAGTTIVKSDFFSGNSIISAGSVLSIEGDGNTITFTGNLLGNGAVNKIDAGTLALDTGSINRNFTGIFTQTDGITIVKSEFFNNVNASNIIRNSTLDMSQATDRNIGNITLDNVTIKTINNSTVDNYTINNLSITGKANFEIDVNPASENNKSDTFIIPSGSGIINISGVNFISQALSSEVVSVTIPIPIFVGKNGADISGYNFESSATLRLINGSDLHEYTLEADKTIKGVYNLVGKNVTGELKEKMKQLQQQIETGNGGSSAPQTDEQQLAETKEKLKKAEKLIEQQKKKREEEKAKQTVAEQERLKKEQERIAKEQERIRTILTQNNILTTRAIFTNSRDSFLRFSGDVMAMAGGENGRWINVNYNQTNHSEHKSSAPEFNGGIRIVGDGKKYNLSILGGFNYNGGVSKDNGNNGKDSGSGGGNNGKVKLTTMATTVGIYGRVAARKTGGPYIDGMVIYTYNSHTDNIGDNVNLSNFLNIKELKYNSHDIGTNLRIGYDLKISYTSSIEPQLNISYISSTIEEHDGFESRGLSSYYISPAFNLNIGTPENYIKSVILTTKYNVPMVPLAQDKSIYNNISDNKANLEIGIDVNFKLGIRANVRYRMNNGFGVGMGWRF